MSANSLVQAVGTTNTDIDTILKMLRIFNEGEQAFNVNAALLKHGRHFEHIDRHPAGLRKGRLGECFKNCTQALMPVICDPHPPYFYAEGYALDGELGIPFEHAWLVDTAGRAIDLTWCTTRDATYYGVAFRSDVLLEAMRLTEVYGILFNPALRGRLFATQAGFAATLRYPGLPGLPHGAVT